MKLKIALFSGLLGLAYGLSNADPVMFWMTAWACPR
jgi:hypothetical protein